MAVRTTLASCVECSMAEGSLPSSRSTLHDSAVLEPHPLLGKVRMPRSLTGPLGILNEVFQPQAPSRTTMNKFWPEDVMPVGEMSPALALAKVLFSLLSSGPHLPIWGPVPSTALHNVGTQQRNTCAFFGSQLEKGSGSAPQSLP